jgi:predicted N-formylglutamate amidohydrolase
LTIAPLVTCEHASRALPARYGTLGLPPRVMRSHVAWDFGAREAARAIAHRLGCPHFEGRYSRLLVDLNRSASNRGVVPRVAFSVAVPGNFTSHAETVLRVERYWRPYRAAIEQHLRGRVAKRRGCVHFAVHSFTPVLGGRRRLCDIGLLFDPRRPGERRIASRLRKSLRSTGLNVRFNYPYRGTSDGLTTAMRGLLPDESYAGIEIEINQRLLASARRRKEVTSALCSAVEDALRGGSVTTKNAGPAQKKR